MTSLHKNSSFSKVSVRNFAQRKLSKLGTMDRLLNAFFDFLYTPFSLDSRSFSSSLTNLQALIRGSSREENRDLEEAKGSGQLQVEVSSKMQIKLHALLFETIFLFTSWSWGWKGPDKTAFLSCLLQYLHLGRLLLWVVAGCQFRCCSESVSERLCSICRRCANPAPQLKKMILEDFGIER